MAWVITPHVMLDLRHAEKVVDQLIADHRSGRITNKENLLAALIEARDPETGDRYSDREIHDELMGFLTAGMETTATTLTWTWKLLAEHPEVRARLHDELHDVLGGRTPSADDLDNLPWTKQWSQRRCACIHQSLRWHESPSAPTQLVIFVLKLVRQ